MIYLKQLNSGDSTGKIEQILSSNDLELLEEEVAQNIYSFVALGAALARIKDAQLYKKRGFQNFEEYLAVTWNLTKNKAFYLIECHRTVQVLCLKPVKKRVQVEDYRRDNKKFSSELITIMPNSEEQIRPLNRFKSNPELIRQIWKRAVDKAANEAEKQGKSTITVTARHIKEEIEKIEKVLRSDNLEELAPLKLPKKNYEQVKVGDDIPDIDLIEKNQFSSSRQQKAQAYFQLFAAVRQAAENLQVWIEAEDVNNLNYLKKSPEGKIEFCDCDVRFIQTAIQSLQWSLVQIKNQSDVIDITSSSS